MVTVFIIREGTQDLCSEYFILNSSPGHLGLLLSKSETKNVIGWNETFLLNQITA